MNEILPFYQLLPINFIRCTEPNSNEVLNRKHHFFPFSVVYWEKKQNYGIFIHLLKQLIKKNEVSNGHLNLDIIAAQRLIWAKLIKLNERVGFFFFFNIPSRS